MKVWFNDGSSGTLNRLKIFLLFILKFWNAELVVFCWLCRDYSFQRGHLSLNTSMHSLEWLMPMLPLLVLHSAALLILRCWWNISEDGSAVPYVALQSCSACQHVVLGPADSSLKGAEPPAGAICIPDKAIHHPHHSAQFGLLHQTAFGRQRRAFTCTCL